MTLTDQERARFAAYCQREADSYRDIACMQEKMGMLPDLIMRQRMLAAAFQKVADQLATTTSMTIGPEDAD